MPAQPCNGSAGAMRNTNGSGGAKCASCCKCSAYPAGICKWLITVSGVMSCSQYSFTNFNGTYLITSSDSETVPYSGGTAYYPGAYTKSSDQCGIEWLMPNASATVGEFTGGYSGPLVYHTQRVAMQMLASSGVFQAVSNPTDDAGPLAGSYLFLPAAPGSTVSINANPSLPSTVLHNYYTTDSGSEYQQNCGYGGTVTITPVAS